MVWVISRVGGRVEIISKDALDDKDLAQQAKQGFISGGTIIAELFGENREANARFIVDAKARESI